MDHRPKCEMQNIEFVEENLGENIGDLGISFQIHQMMIHKRCDKCTLLKL